MGPAGHCPADSSRGTLSVPQGAQRVGKVGTGGGSCGAGGRDRWGRDCPGVGGGTGGVSHLAAVHLRVGGGGCLEGQVTCYIPEVPPTHKGPQGGSVMVAGEVERAGTTEWEPQPSDRVQSPLLASGGIHRQRASCPSPHPPTRAEHAFGSWGHRSPLACAPTSAPSPHRASLQTHLRLTLGRP